MSRLETCSGSGFVLGAVNHRRHHARRLEFSHRGTPCGRPPFRREFYLLSHVRILFAVVIDLEQRGNGFVVVNSFHAFAEKLGDAKHGGLKSFHRAHGRAVRRY